jgi:hypothetical protein
LLGLTHSGLMNTPEQLNESDALLSLIQQVKENYQSLPAPVRRGPKATFQELSWLLLAVVAVALRTFKDQELHTLLTKDEALRQACDFCRVPHRTWIGRRLQALVPLAEAQIAAYGQIIQTEVRPSEAQSAVSAVDGRMYKAQGPRWHKADRLAQRVPPGLRKVDTESQWSKSGYRGWAQGYRLLLQGLVFPCPVPLFAAWRPNKLKEADLVTTALAQKHLAVTDVLLGDEAFGHAPFTTNYAAAGGWVLTPKQLPPEKRSWKDELYDYRKESIELLFQRIIQASELKECQVKGEGRNGAFVLVSVWLYQICFLTNYRAGKPPAYIKEQLDCARWRIRK